MKNIEIVVFFCSTQLFQAFHQRNIYIQVKFACYKLIYEAGLKPESYRSPLHSAIYARVSYFF